MPTVPEHRSRSQPPRRKATCRQPPMLDVDSLSTYLYASALVTQAAKNMSPLGISWQHWAGCLWLDAPPQRGCSRDASGARQFFNVSSRDKKMMAECECGTANRQVPAETRVLHDLDFFSTPRQRRRFKVCGDGDFNTGHKRLTLSPQSELQNPCPGWKWTMAG